MKRKTIAVLLTAITIVSLTACGSVAAPVSAESQVADTASTEALPAATQTAETEAPAEPVIPTTAAIRTLSADNISFEYLFGHYAVAGSDGCWYVTDLNSDNVSPETNVLGETFNYTFTSDYNNIFIGAVENEDNSGYYTSIIYSYDEASDSISEICRFEGGDQELPGWLVSDYDMVTGYFETVRWDESEDGTHTYSKGITRNDYDDLRYYDGFENYSDMEFQIYNGMLYIMQDNCDTRVGLVDSFLTEGDDALDTLTSGDYSLELRGEMNSEGYTLAEAYSNDGTEYTLAATGLYNMLDNTFLPLSEEYNGSAGMYESGNYRTAMGHCLKLVTSEISEGDDTKYYIRAYDLESGAFLTDEEYLQITPCAYDCYNEETCQAYCVKYTDGTYGYLDADFEDLGVSYDKASRMSNMADSENQVSLVESDGSCMVVVNGTTPIETYLLSDGTTSADCPITDYESATCKGNYNGTVYFILNYADDTETLVAITLTE